VPTQPLWQQILADVQAVDGLDVDLAGCQRAAAEQAAAQYAGTAESGDVTVTVDGNGRVVDVVVAPAAVGKATIQLERDVVDAYQGARRTAATAAAQRWSAATAST
jgi:DNA-binding protein YbaB